MNTVAWMPWPRCSLSVSMNAYVPGPDDVSYA